MTLKIVLVYQIFNEVINKFNIAKTFFHDLCCKTVVELLYDMEFQFVHLNLLRRGNCRGQSITVVQERPISIEKRSSREYFSSGSVYNDKYNQ